MKTYKKYMDKISVSNTLHEKIMSSIKNRPKRLPIIIKRYTVAFACIAVVLLGVFTISNLTQNNVTQNQENNSSVLEPDTITPTPDSLNKFTLYFNKIEEQTATSIYIPGHFWQKLTDDEINSIFPILNSTHNIEAIANFQSAENGITLFNIDAHAISTSGLKTYIQIAPDEVVLDYVFDNKTKSSDVLGIKVTAGFFETEPNGVGLKNIIYFATFKLSDVAYYVELSGVKENQEIIKNEITEIIGLLIESGTVDLDVFHPALPELSNVRLNLDEARADVDFGVYLPREIPHGFMFEDAQRIINQEQNVLMANWSKGTGYINWQISFLDEDDKSRITSVTDTKNYDLSLYPIPRAESVPDELSEIVENPIFNIDELTHDVVKSRIYAVQDSGDESGQRMRFSVLYEDVLVELNINGVSPEEVFDILQQIKK